MSDFSKMTNTERLAHMQREVERLGQALRHITPDTYGEAEVLFEIKQARAAIAQLKAAIADGHP